MLLAGCGFTVGGGTTDGGGSDRDDGGFDGDGPVTGDTAPPGCDAPPTWADGFAPVTTVHVDPLTSSSQEDGTAANPFSSIEEATAVATPGTRILLSAGAYAEVTLTNLHGTATAPIWIEGPQTGPRAVFSVFEGIRLVAPQYVVIRYLEFADLLGDAIRVDDGGQANFGAAHHLAITDVDVSNVTNAFQIRGVTDVAIYRATVTSATRGAQLWGVHRAVLAKLSLASISTAPVQFAAGSRDITVRQSRIIGAGTRAVWIGGSSTEVDFRPPLAATDNYEARDLRVFDNFIDGHEAGIVCSSCTDVLIANNRITGDLTHVIRVINEHPSGLSSFAFPNPASLRVIANAIEVTSNPFGLRMESNTSCASCVFSHNQWLEIDNPQDSTPPLPVIETSGIYGVPSGYDAQGRLCAGGAAIGTGTVVPEVNGTFLGECHTTPRSIGPQNPDTGC